MNAGQRINSETTLNVLLWCCALLSGFYFAERILVQENFGFHDWYLFIGHAKTFLVTNILYDRDLSHYEPSAAIYKFPPLYASILVFFLHCGFTDETIKQIIKIIYFFCYFFSFVILLRLPQYKNKSLPISTALIIAFTFEPFFDNYDSSQMEVYVLLALSLGLLYLLRGKELVSGIFIGLATAIKIYPIYFAGYYLASKKYYAIAGIVLGMVIATAFSVTFIGWPDHEFYLDKILPTLLTEIISGKGENLSLGRLLLAIGWSMKTAELLCLVILLLPMIILFIRSFFSRGTKTHNHPGIWFSILITTLLLATKNSWWNYQILLIIPLLVILGSPPRHKKIAYLSITLLGLAYVMIFWCNLGKLDILIRFASIILDTFPVITPTLLKINLLRGLGTFLILSVLVLTLACQNRQNISLVENRPST
jgi:hypothetical protein